MVKKLLNKYYGKCNYCDIEMECEDEDILYEGMEEHIEMLLKEENIGFCRCPKCGGRTLVKRGNLWNKDYKN